jgi:hypothetical protein
MKNAINRKWSMTQKRFILIVVSACVELTAWVGVCGIDPFLEVDEVKRRARNTSISNSLSFKALSNALALANSIIDERCLCYAAFERIFPPESGTNQFLRYGMGDESVRSLANNVFEALDPEVREDVLETMISDLEKYIDLTDTMWNHTSKKRAEMIAWLSPEQMRKWFILAMNRKALFYKLLEEKLMAKEKEDANNTGRKGDE